MGRLIPAGTGLGAYKRLTVDVASVDEDGEDVGADGSYLSRGKDADDLAEAAD